MLLPLPLVAATLLGLFSLALLPVACYLLYLAWRRYRRTASPVLLPPPDYPSSPATPIPTSRPSMPLRNPRVLIPLAWALFLFLFTFLGLPLAQLAVPAGPDEPQPSRTGVPSSVTTTDNRTLHVESYGPPDAPILLLTHGWSLNSTEWFYTKRDLSQRFHLVVWDLPGLGQSTPMPTGTLTLESMAEDLRAVLAHTTGKPVFLVGHSIGGMINLTFCRLHPELLGPQVAGIVQIDTSYTNPVRTMKDSQLNLALQKPVAEPILHLMTTLSPLVRVMNWFSYRNGTMFAFNASNSFAGAETRGQVDFLCRLQAEASPAVVAQGVLAMFHWDATPVLPRINVPVLLIVGQQDTTTLPEASEHMRAAIPHATLATVAPSNHFSLLEQNQAVSAGIRQFVLSHPPSTDVSTR